MENRRAVWKVLPLDKGAYVLVGSVSVGLGTGCSLCSTMARISSTVPLSPKKLLLIQKS